MHRLFIFASLSATLLLLLTASGCSDDSQPSTCSAKCDGCCSTAGLCQAGTTDTACGSKGGKCTACTGGKKCINGTCQAPACGTATCSGCCLSGSCVEVAAQGAASCGVGGVACSTCPTGQNCTNGACQSGACGPTTCQQGCCANATTCFNFAQQNAGVCGTAGAACAACPGGTQCLNGVCSGGCNAQNCAGGCCTATGQCILFAQQNASACGGNGNLCATCPSPGVCQSGVCQGTGTCNATTCGGGCCQGPACILYAQQTNALCGKSGAICQSCGAFSCSAGTCGDNWKVGVVSAVLTNKPSGDWDPIGISGKAPDPMVFVKVNASNVTGQTAFINDQLTPTYNQDVLTDTSANLTNPLGILVEARDDDSPIGFEVMGQCTAVLTLADLQAGTKVLSGCTAQTTSVTLRFMK